MKKQLIILMSLMLLGCSSPMDLTNIREGGKLEFEQLNIQPGYELEDLRIDIIRQEKIVQVDSVESTEKVSYHPIGFNLGNGLFYDLNENLSIRPQELLMISPTETYQIKKITNVKKEKGIRIKEKSNEQICERWENTLGKEKEICKGIQREEEDLTITKKGKFCYKIIENGDTLRYTKNRKERKWTIIEPFETTSFKVIEGKREELFKQEGETVILNSKYSIKRLVGEGRLEIYKMRKSKNRLLYKIEKGIDEVYVYNKKSNGYKIETKEGNLIVYKNEKPLYELERVK